MPLALQDEGQAGAASHNKLMTRVYNWFGGKATFFAMMVFWATVFLAMKGKLTPEVTALMAIVQGLVVYRSVKQDHVSQDKQ